MYNRYTPRQDGGFRRDRVPESSESARNHSQCPQPQPHCPPEHPVVEQPRQDCCVPSPAPSNASGFLSGLLPKNMDTGDLLMLLILLLLLNDGSESAPDPLLTIALFFLME
ncbi:MAG: hypothetical protein E7459_06470 [Ruminococcaceae bacterium]|nr:hypothetical protein [Oscillospiraceae bacterium]